MADSLIENVSDTAFWVAHYRAVETQRPDALFHDPFAGLLAGEQGRKIAQNMPMRFMTEWVVALRTRIIDEYIQTALAQGIDAVLNLGTGLDTRPYRMELPESLLWVEADYPRMIEYKQARLAGQSPRCQLRRVAVDLADDAARRGLLADIDSHANKMLILTEGVIVYLPVEAVGTLADDLKGLRHARYWIIEYLSPQAIKFRERGGIGQKTQNAPFKFKPVDWFGFFRGHGCPQGNSLLCGRRGTAQASSAIALGVESSDESSHAFCVQKASRGTSQSGRLCAAGAAARRCSQV
jgi:methyltransferase (TIGR00027 family)